MKKIIASLLTAAIFIGGCLFTYHYYYGGTDYYTQITTTGDHDTTISSDGVVEDIYRYQQTAYNAQGDSKEVKLQEYRSNPLKEGAFLKLVVNPHKGVLRWEEVDKAQVPQQALSAMTD